MVFRDRKPAWLNKEYTHVASPHIIPPLAKALAERGYDTLTEVQSAVIAPEADGRDLIVSSKTGSGKTVAYGLGIAPTLLGDKEQFIPTSVPHALIVAPTRELALQVERELEWLYANTGARIVSCVGGMDPKRERRMLADGAHIVVGTPGRLRDHITRRALDLSGLRAIVLDEADEMLDLGFREDLEFILDETPPERRTLLFSATLPKAIIAMARRYQSNALRIEASATERGHVDIEYRAMRVAYNEVDLAVINTLRLVESPAALVFCNTRDGVRRMQALLVERGFSAVMLSGELGQHERNQALQALRDQRARICVATDVAARGIDLPNLGLVIHADLPNDPEVMQHRSGRTGRAGRKGVSVLIVPPSRRRKAEMLLSAAGVKATWVAAPSAEDIRAQDRQRMLDDPLLTQEGAEEDVAMAQLLIANRTPDQIALALARVFRARLPEPEDVEEMAADTAPRRDARDAPRRERSESPRRERNDGPRGDAPPRDYSNSDRAPRAPRHVSEPGAVKFRMNVGRQTNADPKWLLPMLCRRGNVTRQEIGSIRIFDTVSEVEISAHAAEAFAASVAHGGAGDVAIQRITNEASIDNQGGDRDAGFGAGGGKPPHRGKSGFKGAARTDNSFKGGPNKGRFDDAPPARGKGYDPVKGSAPDTARRENARQDNARKDNARPDKEFFAKGPGYGGPKGKGSAGGGYAGKGAADKGAGDKGPLGKNFPDKRPGGVARDGFKWRKKTDRD
jgi:ATP-dependent RNA helicase DeaD